MKTIMTIFLLAALVLAAGCASPGSPRVDFSKDVHVTINQTGSEPAAKYGNVDVKVDYEQSSATDLEAALKQVLDLDLQPEIGLDD